MAEGFMPAVVVTLLADTKEFSAKMDEAAAKMDEVGGEAEATGGKFSKFASLASTAILAVGAAFAGEALHKAYDFQEMLDQIRDQTNITTGALNVLGNAILNAAEQTGVSTSDLGSAAMAVEQAGIHGAKAIQMLDDAAKISTITNYATSATSAMQSLIAVENLQMAKGLGLQQVSGLLVAGSKDFVGGFSAETNVLQGKIGVALSQYGLKLKQVIPLGAELSRLNLPTRSVTSFVTAFGKIEAPVETLMDTSGKVEKGISSYALLLQQFGLSVTKLQADLKAGNIAGMLLQIKDAAEQSHTPLTEVMNEVFGTGGAPIATVLLQHVNELKQMQGSLQNAGPQSFAQAFSIASKQLGPQLHILEQQLDVIMIRAGKYLLPAMSDVLSWVSGFISALQKDPVLRDMFGAGAGALFAAALAVKIKSAVQGIMGLFGKASHQVQQSAQTGLLEQIAANTAQTAAATEETAAASGTSATEGGATDAVVAGGLLSRLGLTAGAEVGAGGALATFSQATVAFAAGVGAFVATTDILHHLFAGENNPTIQYGKGVTDVIKQAKKHGAITKQTASLLGSNDATIGLGAGTLKYLKKETKVTVLHKTAVKVTR